MEGPRPVTTARGPVAVHRGGGSPRPVPAGSAPAWRNPRSGSRPGVSSEPSTRVAPVSYTHLDVYKRQAGSLTVRSASRRSRSTPWPRSAAAKGVRWECSSGDCSTAVSYTHLDDAEIEANQLVEMTEMSSQIIGQLSDTYNNVLNNNLNDIMRFMTVWSLLLDVYKRQRWPCRACRSWRAPVHPPPRTRSR